MYVCMYVLVGSVWGTVGDEGGVLLDNELLLECFLQGASLGDLWEPSLLRE